MNSPFPAYQEATARVDLTPMLDVVFILLIFFVVTATFVREAGVAVTTPPKAAATPPVEAIVVTVEPAGIFNVNGRLLAKDSLAAYVVALQADNPDAPYAVQVVGTARVGDTVAAVDAGRLLGLDVVPVSRIEP